MWTEAQMVLACGSLDSYYHPEGSGGGLQGTFLETLCGAFEHGTCLPFCLALG